MDHITLIRYADEGFQNHLQSHVQCTMKREPIMGCYAFVEKTFPEMLVFTNEELGLRDRNEDRIHQINVPKDMSVYARNIRLPKDKKSIHISEDGQSVYIPVEPIVKSVPLNQHMERPLSLEEYVEVPIGFVAEQLRLLLSFYAWLQKDCNVSKEAYINTRIIDFAEVIVDTNHIPINNNTRLL